MPRGRRKQSPGRNPELTKDARNLHDAVSELVRVYQFRDRKCIYYYDVSVTQCHAISALLRLGPATLNALAADLYLDKSTASRVVDSLERKGYVCRLADSSDARALRLEVTPKGLSLHKQINQDLVEEMKVLIQDLDPAVTAGATGLVRRLAETAAARFAARTRKPGHSGPCGGPCGEV